MGIVVQKYGGSSVADAQGIKRVAQRIVATKKAGHDVCVVVSRDGRHHRRAARPRRAGLAAAARPRARHAAHRRRAHLDGAARDGDRQPRSDRAIVHRQPGRRHHRLRRTAGRRSSTSRPGRIEQALAEGDIAIVAGFQGVSMDTKDITTLGRGGSDTTAVALAAALQRRGVRDLHRRRRHLHRRPADRARRPAASRTSRTRRCSRCAPPAPRSCTCAASSTPAATTCPSTSARRSRRRPARGSADSSEGGIRWSKRSSPASRTTAARPRSPSSACPTRSARRPASSRRSPTRRSTST